MMDHMHGESVAADLESAFDVIRVRASRGTPLDAATETAEILWLACIARQKPASVVMDEWPTGGNLDRVDSAGPDVRVLHRVEHKGFAACVLTSGNTLVLAQVRGRNALVFAAAASQEEARSVLRQMREHLPEPTAPEGFRVPIALWSYGEREGPQLRTEILDVHDWTGAEENYSEPTRLALQAYVRDVEVGTGKLALWLGPPGTGKTHALRALAWEQRATLRVHYVLDPEVFLERVDYEAAVFDREEDGEHDVLAAPPARLIVLEDAGEFLGADAKSRLGQGLSRLLNLTDGLPGQALRTRVLITSNEEIGKLHPAVTRPGRCGSLVRFAPLGAAEACEWLVSKGRPDLCGGVSGATSVAELYAMLRGEARGSSSSIGFAAHKLSV